MSLDNNILDFKVLTTVNADRFFQAAGVVTTDDPRLTDSRTPLPHTHPTSDITGLDSILAAHGLRLDALEATPIRGSGPPAVVPQKTGLLYVDELYREIYVSVAITSVADWRKLDNMDIDSFRQVGTSPVERWYIAGAATASDFISSPVAFTSIPHVFPCPVTIDKLSINVLAPNAGTFARIGIYESVGGFTDTTPRNLVLDAGEFAINVGGVKTLTVNQQLLPNKLYYFCVIGGTGGVSATARAIPRASCVPFLGVSTAFPSSIGVMWTGPSSYGPFPNPFPNPTASAGDPVAIAMHYSA